MEELKSAEDDEWMNYLRNSNFDIFEMIKRAIMVAASDHPQEFQNQRDMIAQTLFSCDQLINHVEEDETTTTVAQVLKMKEILDNQSSNNESVLLESLSKLRHMVKSVNVLKVTGVGRSVNALRNHASKHVVKVSRTLVKEWKSMVDEWMKKDNIMQKQIKGGEVVEKNPQMEKKIVPTSNCQKRSLIVRIKLKKDKDIDDPKGPLTPDQQKKLVENEEKLKATKRKLQEAYEEAENTKRKRRIQVIEFHQLNNKPQIKPLKRKTIRR